MKRVFEFLAFLSQAAFSRCFAARVGVAVLHRVHLNLGYFAVHEGKLLKLVVFRHVNVQGVPGAARPGSSRSGLAGIGL